MIPFCSEERQLPIQAWMESMAGRGRWWDHSWTWLLGTGGTFQDNTIRVIEAAFLPPWRSPGCPTGFGLLEIGSLQEVSCAFALEVSAWGQMHRPLTGECFFGAEAHTHQICCVWHFRFPERSNTRGGICVTPRVFPPWVPSLLVWVPKTVSLFSKTVSGGLTFFFSLIL